MTVSTTTNKAIHTGNNSLVTFAYTYRMDQDSDMEVYLDDVLQPSGYVVSRNPDDIGGTVTFDIAPAAGVIVTLLRYIDFTQETDYVPYDPFPAESHEDALDKLTMITQQIQEQVDRNTQRIGGSPDTDTSAPPYDSGKCWKWSTTEQKVINSTYDPDQQVILAQGYANDALTYANNSNTYAQNSLTYSQDSYGWANTPEDVLFRSSTNQTGYSAYHWAQKALSAVTGVDSVNGKTGTVVLEAIDIPFDETVSGFLATNVQGAIDENATNIAQLNTDLTQAITDMQAYADEQAIVYSIALG